MSTKNISNEQISALIDHALPDAQYEVALAALRDPAGQAQWDVYHHIGDVLRSDELDITISTDFMTRLRAQLEKEPTVLAPPQRARWEKPLFKTMLASAAIVAVSVIITPAILEMMKHAPILRTTTLASTTGTAAIANNAQQKNALLRDPGIDAYLLAHQRFSPAVYSTAQYARSATFAIDSDK